MTTHLGSSTTIRALYVVLDSSRIVSFQCIETAASARVKNHILPPSHLYLLTSLTTTRPVICIFRTISHVHHPCVMSTTVCSPGRCIIFLPAFIARSLLSLIVARTKVSGKLCFNGTRRGETTATGSAMVLCMQNNERLLGPRGQPASTSFCLTGF